MTPIKPVNILRRIYNYIAAHPAGTQPMNIFHTKQAKPL